MESLLKVINWPGRELEHITVRFIHCERVHGLQYSNISKKKLFLFILQFVTRAVRVIDLITNIDMQGFQAHSGLASFIKRLDMEVNVCRKEQPFEIIPEIEPPVEAPQAAAIAAAPIANDADEPANPSEQQEPPVNEGDETSNTMETSEDENTSSKSEMKLIPPQNYTPVKTGKTCLPQRAALIKSMLNFLKKAIQDPMFNDSIRHIMEGTLPSSLKHIISNSEYYGSSLFLLATDVVTVYVFQEPSLLSTLQDNGLTDVVLHALLNKEVSLINRILLFFSIRVLRNISKK